MSILEKLRAYEEAQRKAEEQKAQAEAQEEERRKQEQLEAENRLQHQIKEAVAPYLKSLTGIVKESGLEDILDELRTKEEDLKYVVSVSVPIQKRSFSRFLFGPREKVKDKRQIFNLHSISYSSINDPAIQSPDFDLSYKDITPGSRYEIGLPEISYIVQWDFSDSERTYNYFNIAINRNGIFVSSPKDDSLAKLPWQNGKHSERDQLEDDIFYAYLHPQRNVYHHYSEPKESMSWS